MYHRFKWTQVSNRRNWISREYEPLQPYFILELARAAGSETFVDVGANIGLYSVVMSQLVNEVIAYEAIEALVKEIKDELIAHCKGSMSATIEPVNE